MIRRSVMGSTIGSVLGLSVVVAVASPAAADWVRDQQWHLAHLGLPEAWDVSTGAGVSIGMIEGAPPDRSHPDLAGSVREVEIINGVSEPDDHATGIAGLMVARGHGADGIVGVAPGAVVLGYATSDDVDMAAAFRHAADSGVGVVNCSCQLDGPSAEVEDAIAYALDRDVVVVISAGNTSGGPVVFPGAYDGVITVAALDREDRPTRLSASGPQVDLAAPAAEMPTTGTGGTYKLAPDGTSNAAAVVSGVAALVRSAHPELDASNIIARLLATAKDVGRSGWDEESGAGVVDPLAALTVDVDPVVENPLGHPRGADGPPDQTSEPAESDGSTTRPPTASRPPEVSGVDPCPTGAEAGAADPTAVPAPAPPAPAGGSVSSTEDCDPVAGATSYADGIPAAAWVAAGLAVVALLTGGVLWRARRARPARPG